jgi:hypothetical protein
MRASSLLTPRTQPHWTGTALGGGDLSGSFALDLMENMTLENWQPSLRHLLGPQEIRKRILEISADDAKIIPDTMVVEAMTGSGPAAEQAIRTAFRRGLTGISGILSARLADGSPGVRAAAAGALYRLDLHKPAAKITLLEMLQDGNQTHRAAAIDELADLPELMADDLAAEYLRSPSPAIREAALRVAARRGSLGFIPLALDCLVASIRQ